MFLFLLFYTLIFFLVTYLYMFQVQRHKVPRNATKIEVQPIRLAFRVWSITLLFRSHQIPSRARVVIVLSLLGENFAREREFVLQVPL